MVAIRFNVFTYQKFYLHLKLHKKCGKNCAPQKQEVRNQCISCFCMIISLKTTSGLLHPFKFIPAGALEPWFQPCAVVQSSGSDTPTAQRGRQGGLVKSYFYPQYLNSDGCRGVFDVTWSSRQSADYSGDQWKIFTSHSFHFCHLCRMLITRFTLSYIICHNFAC